MPQEEIQKCVSFFVFVILKESKKLIKVVLENSSLKHYCVSKQRRIS